MSRVADVLADVGDDVGDEEDGFVSSLHRREEMASRREVMSS